jgi:hypothetical protein
MSELTSIGLYFISLLMKEKFSFELKYQIYDNIATLFSTKETTFLGMKFQPRNLLVLKMSKDCQYITLYYHSDYFIDGKRDEIEEWINCDIMNEIEVERKILSVSVLIEKLFEI